MSDLKISDSEELPAEDAENDADQESSISYIHSGLKKTLEEAEKLLKANPAKLIVLAGHPDAGKTTLFASIYELFQKGTVSPYSFAGSFTLMEFENICHKSRLESGNIKPDTPRTAVGDGEKVLHLALKHDSQKIDLLLADISGERFMLAKDSKEICQNIISLKRADVIGIQFDMEKLLNPVLRHSTKADCVGLIRAMVDYGVLSPKTNVQLIFSKWDEVENKEQEEQMGGFITSIETSVREILGSQFEAFRISTKPKARAFDSIPTLLQSWLQSKPSGIKANIVTSRSHFINFSNKALP